MACDHTGRRCEEDCPQHELDLRLRLTNEELEDLISDAISDSIDMDWSPRDGARSVAKVLRQLDRETRRA